MSNELLSPTELSEDLIDFPTLFHRQVAASPDRIAVIFEDEQVTYRELDERSNRVANQLATVGVGKQQCVGLSLDRSIDAIAAMMGVMKIGAVFVPLDPEFPQDRLAYIIEDAGIEQIICEQQYQELYENEPNANLIDLAQLREASNEDPAVDIDPEDLAYIMYTSGSTGKPKGVQIEHRSLATYCFADIEVYELVESDRTLQFSTLNFDIAIEEIFPPLLMGSSVVVRPRGRADAQNELSSIVEKNGVTAIHLATAYWHEWVDLMKATGARVPETIRLMVVTGEKVSAEHFRRWKTLCDQDVLWCNAYGPTEATVSATVFIPDQDWDGDNMPIGKPLKRYDGHILDANNQPVADGETGELLIGGPALARGYLNRPDLTEKAFVKIQLDGDSPTTLYKTGDLARWLPNGDIEFAGRIDHQIKLGSYRIEPGEIEAAVNQHPEVLESLITYDEVGGKKYLICYVAQGSHEIALANLTQHLRDRLPPYMIPTRFVVVESFPKTINGKIDRKALPSPATSVVARDSNYAAPTTELEKELVAIWEDVLNVPQVGVNDDFFALGGSSLLVTRVIAQISQHLKTELPVRDFFANPTIALIAQHIESLNNIGDPTTDRVAAARKALRATLPKIEAEFFASGNETLYGVHYRPVQTSSENAVLLCSSFGHEYSRAHRPLQQLAVMLAKRGCHVLRFDYSNTGNSSGDAESGNADNWVRDIDVAANRLRECSGLNEIGIVGVRFGATLVSSYAKQRANISGSQPHREDKLIYWDPVISGRAMLEMMDSFHQESLTNLSIFPVPRKGSTANQVFGSPISKEQRESVAKTRFVPDEASAIVTSKDYCEHEGLPSELHARLVSTSDEVYWHSLPFSNRAFSSPESFDAILKHLVEAK